MGIPFTQNKGIPIYSLCYVTNWEFPLKNINMIVLCYAKFGLVKILSYS